MSLGRLLRKTVKFLLFLSAIYFVTYGINYKLGESVLGAYLSISTTILLFMMFYYPLFFPRRTYALCLISIILLIYHIWLAISIIIFSLFNLVGLHSLPNIIYLIKHVLRRLKGG